MKEMNEEDTHDGGLPPAKKQKVVDSRPADNGLRSKTSSTDNNTESDKYTDYVNPEEVERLKEFRVLDEVKSNDEASHDSDSDSSSGESAELPEEEIEKMLEENLPDDFKAPPKPKEKPYVIREKILLEEKGVNQFEVLPADWILIRHQSGIPVYVHRPSRVCTVSRPYFIGAGNAKRHDIPISAIPCLSYRRALEEEERQKLIDQKVEGETKVDTRNTNNKETQDKPTISETDKKDPANENENSSGTTDTGSQSKCPFKQGLIERDIKICPVTKATVGSDDSSSTTQDVPMADTDDADASAKGAVDKPGTANENGSTDSSSDNIVKELAKEAAEMDKVAFPVRRPPVVLPDGVVMASPRVETVSASWQTQHLTHAQVHDYCKKLFKFKVLSIMHFNSWADRRKYTKARKALQYPVLPEGTKLISIPVQPAPGQDASGAGKPTKRDWVMNMNGRSYLSVFHEYARRALQKQPVYEFKQLENASTPYQATVFIGGMQYGVGRGSSKRQAKSAAARASIHILIPEMRDHLEPAGDAEPDFVFFDYVGIEDPRIVEFCAATCEPTPHAILRTCLLRNFGTGDRHIHTEMKKLEHQKVELTMKVGKHSATVVCKNKKAAKQRASQAILQALHPHVRSWGSLLRLYGSRSVKSCKERKLEEQQITLLQDKARHNEPNYAVLDKLRAEMRKLRERDEAVVPIGTLLLAHDLPTHSGSNLNNVDL